MQTPPSAYQLKMVNRSSKEPGNLCPSPCCLGEEEIALSHPPLPSPGLSPPSPKHTHTIARNLYMKLRWQIFLSLSFPSSSQLKMRGCEHMVIAQGLCQPQNFHAGSWLPVSEPAILGEQRLKDTAKPWMRSPKQRVDVGRLVSSAHL